MNPIASYFAHIAENLECIASELEMDLSDIHAVEIIPNAPDAYGVVKEWCAHINDEQFAYVRRNRHGKCEVSFSAWYSDFYYLFKPEEAQTA